MSKPSNFPMTVSASRLKAALQSNIPDLLSPTDIPEGEEHLLHVWESWDHSMADSLCVKLKEFHTYGRVRSLVSEAFYRKLPVTRACDRQYVRG